MKKTIEELKKEAAEMLKNDDSLFCDMVNELDGWNGFADGFRAWPMWEIDDLFCGCKVSDFLSKLTSTFNYTDDYFCDTVYGLDSCDDCAEWYREHTDEEEVLEYVLDNKNHIYINDPDFREVIDEIINYEEEEEEE